MTLQEFLTDRSMPPALVLFSFKNMPSSIITKMSKQWGVGHSKNGWVISDSFNEYLTNVFFPQGKTKQYYSSCWFVSGWTFISYKSTYK